MHAPITKLAGEIPASSLCNGERQVAETVDGIRRDHVARYEWLASRLPASSRVLDIACGVGYGAQILAEAGHRVIAIDRDAEAISYAKEHYAHQNITFMCRDAAHLGTLPILDAVACFETLEHIAEPEAFLRELRRLAPRLYVSVPNEDHFPFGHGYAFHHRHYTRGQLDCLLRKIGFSPVLVAGQHGSLSEVDEEIEGRTLIMVADRSKPDPTAVEPEAPPKPAKGPRHIAIVAFGPTSAFYLDAAKKDGSRQRFADFVIGVNAMGSVIQCDLVMHMDDVRIQERRATADPEGHVAGLLEWLKGYRGRVMTSRAHPDYPHLEEMPLEDMLNEFQGGYINGTGAAALAYAIYLRPEEISLWGFDFTYPNSHKNERGRACVEYWMGRAHERGIMFRLPPKTSLMDSFEDSASDEAHFYGYDTMKVIVTGSHDADTGRISFSVTKTPLPESEWPTAEDVEAAYDHGKHPNEQGRAKR